MLLRESYCKGPSTKLTTILHTYNMQCHFSETEGKTKSNSTRIPGKEDRDQIFIIKSKLRARMPFISNNQMKRHKMKWYKNLNMNTTLRDCLESQEMVRSPPVS